MHKKSISNLRRKLEKKYRVVKLNIEGIIKYKIQEKQFIFFWTNSHRGYYDSYGLAFCAMRNFIKDDLWESNYWEVCTNKGE